METVTKSSLMGGAFASLPKFSSDASKVVSRGAGLSKAFVGQKNTFTVDCSKAGEGAEPETVTPPSSYICLMFHTSVCCDFNLLASVFVTRHRVTVINMSPVLLQEPTC